MEGQWMPVDLFTALWARGEMEFMLLDFLIESRDDWTGSALRHRNSWVQL